MATPIASTPLLWAPDIARFLLVYSLLVVLPGFALATLFRPRSPVVERLVLALPAAYALLSLIGLATALAHAPFTPLIYAVPAALITLCAVFIRRRMPAASENAASMWDLTPLAVGLLQLVVIAIAMAPMIVPPDVDTVSHTQWIDLLRHAQTFPLALLGGATGDSGGFYPPAFHVLAAFVVQLAPMPTYRASFYSAVAAVAWLPLAMYAFTRVATRSPRIAALATVSSLAYLSSPYIPLSQGLYPFLLSLVFVVALALTLRDALTGQPGSIVCAALLGVGLFYTHPTEFVTAALLTVVLLPAAVQSRAAWRRATISMLIVGGAWLIAAAPALAAVRATMSGGAQTEMQSRHFFVVPAHIDLAHILSTYADTILGFAGALALPLLLGLAGCAWTLANRRLRLLPLVTVALLVAYVDSQTFNVFGRLYALSFPWALPERLRPASLLVLAPLMGCGLDLLIGLAARRLRHRFPLFTLAATFTLAILCIAGPTLVNQAQLATDARAQTYVDRADVGALRWLSRHNTPGSLVVDEVQHLTTVGLYWPVDAGLWVPVAGGPTPLFWRDGAGPGPLDDRLFVLAHMGDRTLPVRARAYIRTYHARYVLYGSWTRPGAGRHLRLGALLHSPNLRLAYASVSTCRPSGSHTTQACPPRGSYVFALRV